MLIFLITYHSTSSYLILSYSLHFVFLLPASIRVSRINYEEYYLIVGGCPGLLLIRYIEFWNGITLETFHILALSQ
jgi:hypothetical protein